MKMEHLIKEKTNIDSKNYLDNVVKIKMIGLLLLLQEMKYTTPFLSRFRNHSRK